MASPSSLDDSDEQVGVETDPRMLMIQEFLVLTGLIWE